MRAWSVHGGEPSPFNNRNKTPNTHHHHHTKQTGSDHQPSFSSGALFLFFAFYISAAVVTYGTAVPSGKRALMSLVFPPVCGIILFRFCFPPFMHSPPWICPIHQPSTHPPFPTLTSPTNHKPH